jgi:hypothetical protein
VQLVPVGAVVEPAKVRKGNITIEVWRKDNQESTLRCEERRNLLQKFGTMNGQWHTYRAETFIIHDLETFAVDFVCRKCGTMAGHVDRYKPLADISNGPGKWVACSWGIKEEWIAIKTTGWPDGGAGGVVEGAVEAEEAGLAFSAASSVTTLSSLAFIAASCVSSAETRGSTTDTARDTIERARVRWV